MEHFPVNAENKIESQQESQEQIQSPSISPSFSPPSPPPLIPPPPPVGLFNKLGKAVEKLNNSSLMMEMKQEKEFQVKSNVTASTILSTLNDKKAILLRNKQFQVKLEEFQNQNILDLDDKETCSLVIFLLQKQIKSQQEVQFLGKFIRILSVFKAREELLKTSQISNKIIQNLRCIFIKKHNPLFKYGKAYCLVPYSNTIPIEQIKSQTRTKRLTPQVVEEPSDEEFLFENYPRFQCVKIYKPGEAFGEIALLTTESKRMASIVCKGDSWFMSLNREGFNQIQGSYQQHLLNEKVYFMKKFEIFKPVAINKILSFLHEISEITYIVGQTIYQQGKKGDIIYFLMDGEIEIVREMTHVGPSKLINQKYEMYFKNTKHTLIHKQIVLLGSGNYFGDEDILSNDKVHSYSAICKSQTCKVLEIDLRALASFLKIYEMFNLFKKTAQSKLSHYQQILQEDIISDKNCMIDPLDPIKKNAMNNNLDEKVQANDNWADESQFGYDQNNINTKDKKQSKKNKIQLPIIQSPRESDKLPNNNIYDIDIIKSMSQNNNQSFTPKFHNVYTHLSNQNMRSKNYLSVNNAFSSSVKFSLDDVPMTTKMNQDETDLKRIQFRLSKNIQKSADNKTLAQVPYQKRNSNDYHLSKLAKSLNGSFDNMVSLNMSGKSGKLNIQNKGNGQDTQGNLNDSVDHEQQKAIQIINLNQLNTIRIMEHLEQRKQILQFSIQLRQQSLAPSSIKDSLKNLVQSPLSKFSESFTPQHRRMQTSAIDNNNSPKYQVNSPRENSNTLSSQYSPQFTLKLSKNVNDYQENLIRKKNKSTFAMSNQVYN